jgi:mono/diheme cytochrome c family protein
MTHKKALIVLLASLSIVGAVAAQETPRPAEVGWIDFKKPILADPVMQHAKETFILYGCAYCHGVDLHVRNGEAADLLHSKLVAVDTDGKVISQLLHNGIPQTAKLSPMPQFSDLSEKEMLDLARWIHYSRMEEHYGELMHASNEPAGDITAGKAYFEKTCSSCHSTADMAKSLSKVKAENLKAYVLKPALLEAIPSFALAPADMEHAATVRSRHSALLENYTVTEVANLVAYLKTLK